MAYVVNKNTNIIILIVSVWWLGCSSNQTVSASYLFLDSTKSITLYLIDGRIVSFAPDNYTAKDNIDSCFVTGTGVVSKEGSYKQEYFSGTINFRAIKEMKFSEPPPTSSLTPLLVAASLIVALLVFMTTFKT
ncbi:MAG: hypothetical protein WDA22_15275 [Bacteroidota bacterium]